MPYLNWKDAAVLSTLVTHADLENQMELTLSAELAKGLSARLREVFEENAGELRVDLPKNWAVFWKKREEESRLLLAHPEKDEWVATLALEQSHGASSILALSQAVVGDVIRISELGNLGSVSNVEVLIQIT